MPYKSEKQRAWFHTDSAKKAGITQNQVNEYDETSKSKNLPRFTNLKKKLEEKK